MVEISERDLQNVFFPDFLFGQDGRFGKTLFDHPQFISSCGRTCGEWTISVHLFFGLFMILLQIAYKQISEALRHGNHTSECSIHIRCVTSKLKRFSRCTKIRDLAKSHLAAISRMFKGGSHDTQWMYKMAQTNYRWNLCEVFWRFTGQTKTPQQVGIPKTRVSLESRSFFSKLFEGSTLLLKVSFSKKIIGFLALKKRKKDPVRSRLEVIVGPNLFFKETFDQKKHNESQHFFGGLTAVLRWRPWSSTGNHSWKVFFWGIWNSPFFFTQRFSTNPNNASKRPNILQLRRYRKNTEFAPHVRIETSLFFWICPRRSNKTTVVNHPILILFDQQCSKFLLSSPRQKNREKIPKLRGHRNGKSSKVVYAGIICITRFWKKMKQCQSAVILRNFEGSSLWILHEVWVGHIHIILT